ncbi:fatty acid desaturase [Nannizzia gypsea CBS 118893]|uniref:Fatty acid desaturase n=1 Tax=Arthroderma gypseum (strain ATCC MYA-4604 / CBS 118893) TaxID=535722 RepID=E4UZ90_ARTGP|nr:fatty acid desaturase [Nannizzia gypsea CBS 118893]EFR03420.1 fatty acid desaturase [Nannizzia gypsea CBS 118893]
MDPASYVDPNLTQPDLLVLKCLLRDVEGQPDKTQTSNGHANGSSDGRTGRRSNAQLQASPRNHHEDEAKADAEDERKTIEHLRNLNDPSHDDFDPTVFVSWDTRKLPFPAVVQQWLIRPYIARARQLVRVETDVAMLTHLLLYFSTSVPSAVLLFYRFSWLHGVIHILVQAWYMGTYTLMMHQHIHMGGILDRKYWLFDMVFPYITNPLMGHTWNSYYYHHVKHHHVEGNGPEDLSSTIRYQRDELADFLAYKGKYVMAAKAAGWELSTYLMLGVLFVHVDARATVFVFLLPLMLMRIAMMVGNWGQHALVDEIDPTSDFRSSITLIDVPSNRFCFNDGYHTSHHLNPRRHWREHPVAFLSQRQRYSQEQALVFRNIDYIMMTVKLLQKDYDYLARCMVPIGEKQISMTMKERAAMLRTKTRRFSEEEIARLFK